MVSISKALKFLARPIKSKALDLGVVPVGKSELSRIIGGEDSAGTPPPAPPPPSSGLGGLQFGNTYEVGPSGVHIPATLGILPGSNPATP